MDIKKYLISRRNFIKAFLTTAFSLSPLASSFVVGKETLALSEKRYPNFTFCFVTDPHLSYSRNSTGWVVFNESVVILQDVVRQIVEINPDFVFWGGDLIDNQDGMFNDIDIYLDTINPLSMPQYLVLGDREANLAPGYLKGHFTKYFRQQTFKIPGRSYWSADIKDTIHLIGLDSSVVGKKLGRIDQEQLDWLEQDLNSHSGQFIIIGLHHSPQYLSEIDKTPVWSEYVLENGAAFCSLIKKFPDVQLVLSGHHHVNKIQQAFGTVFLNSASVSTYPNQFKVISCKKNVLKIETRSIRYRQIIEKSKKQLIHSHYAVQFNSKSPKKVLNMHEGEESDRFAKFILGNKKVF